MTLAVFYLRKQQGKPLLDDFPACIVYNFQCWICADSVVRPSLF